MSTTTKGKKKTTSKGEIKSAKAKMKTKKPPTEKKPKRTSALDAAAEVLKKTGKPMGCTDLIAAMSEQGLWTSPGGKTPHATLNAAIQREIVAKGRTARFKKVDRGQYEFNVANT